MASCSNSALRSLSRASRSTWSSDPGRPPKDGAPSCVTIHRTSRPWIYIVTPTLGFDVLYAFIIVRLARRDLVWINVTPHPTADWIARQITEAFPWNESPRYLIRDRDQVYGVAVRHRLRAMGSATNLSLQARLGRTASRKD